MDRNNLKKEIEEISILLKKNSTDAKFAEKLIDKLISLKGQYDVEPTRLYILEKDVIKEYDYDNSRIVKCRNCIIWQFKGGYSIIIKPTMRAFYEYIDSMLSMRDRHKELSENEKQLYEAVYFGLCLIVQAPMFAITDEEFFVELSKFVGDGVAKVSEKLLNQPLQEETPEENAEFEIKNEVANELLKDGKDSDKDA